MRSHGITLGCTATTYCPADNVSRVQMAIFMQRLARSIHSENVITVAKAYADFTSIQAAIDAAALMVTDTNPMVVKVAPGIYNEHVTLKDGVSVQGSGLGSTLISYNGAGGTLTAGAAAELRDIAIENNFSGVFPGAVGVYQSGNTFPGAFTLLTRVQVAVDGTVDNTAIYVTAGGLAVEGRSVTASPASGTGQSAGIYATGATSSVTVRGTTILAGTGSAQHSVVIANGATARVANSQLGKITQGAPTCFNTYTNQFLPRTCD
jgi:hypothetical protein